MRADGPVLCTWPGRDPVELCWMLAGFIGLHPRKTTLRQLWLMTQGRLEYSRQLLVSHRSAIATLFSKTISVDCEQFVQYGLPEGGVKEPKLEGVDDKVAEMLRTGKVTFDGQR